MALWDDVVARYSTEKLRALTNPDDRTVTAIDATVGALAVADTEADFLTHAEVAFDSSDERHVAAGVRGVIAHLMSYGAAHSEGAEAAMRRFHERLEKIRNTGPRGRISPATQSQLEPSDEFAGTGPFRPDFDRDRFGGIVPDNRTTEDEDEGFLGP